MASLVDVIAKAPATFPLSVKVPVAGADAIPLQFTANYRSRSEQKAWIDSLDERELSHAQAICELAAGWDLSDEFTEANVDRLADKFPALFRVVLRAYADELVGLREKN